MALGSVSSGTPSLTQEDWAGVDLVSECSAASGGEGLSGKGIASWAWAMRPGRVFPGAGYAQVLRFSLRNTAAALQNGSARASQQHQHTQRRQRPVRPLTHHVPLAWREEETPSETPIEGTLEQYCPPTNPLSGSFHLGGHGAREANCVALMLQHTAKGRNMET
ncbi:hypothetical protein B2J93_9144 [Marssonina coronariae]|uniref:Uncharacterized protein n=1 Tax=Diplocarpon coronariae TaxID=2795749 RepID=A0A218YS77_9HELO|nr:hypothetical protein B2J93_9144 [Marssonina coronariae]